MATQSKYRTFTMHEVAEFMQCSVSTITRLIIKGKFAPTIKPGGQRLVVAEDFWRWIEDEKDRERERSTICGVGSQKRGRKCA
jgi:DNA binding domain, excisionase family